METDKYSMGPSAAAAQHQQPECDYDKNPTVLYQAIEAKQWDYAISLFNGKGPGNESATWVVRKETNGKLRWRLLPLHAAVIFGTPLKLVEALLADYPAAAQCKDDQGMLPLHLAFRNEGSSSWEIIDELLTAYPQAIFIKDRKGRTPLQCGIQVTSSSAVSVNSGPAQTKSFKSIVSVLDLYSQIVVSGERHGVQQETRKQVEARIAQIQDGHLKTLTTLKQEWNIQQEESKMKISRMQKKHALLEEKAKSQEATIASLRSTEADLQSKLETLGGNTDPKQSQAEIVSNAPEPQQGMTNDLLRSMVGDLVNQQREYHDKFRALVEQYDKLLEERRQVHNIFFRDADQQSSREAKIIDSYKRWLKEKESDALLNPAKTDSSISASNTDRITKNTTDEKKVEDAFDFMERLSEQATKMEPPSIGTSVATVAPMPSENVL